MTPRLGWNLLAVDSKIEVCRLGFLMEVAVLGARVLRRSIVKGCAKREEELEPSGAVVGVEEGRDREVRWREREESCA
jgi:hypothetical protein